ncbi:MAG: hypothetical protein M3Q55_08865 [Acidobacteriota bacterium]|nr:hypothetical protein [Acidobacteriota bacterium]
MTRFRLFLMLVVLVTGGSIVATAQQVSPGIQAISALNACVTWNLPPAAVSVTAQITGTFTGTITFRASSDGQTYFDVAALNLSSRVAATTTTTTGQFALTNTGLVKVRACMTAYTSGGANIGLTRGYGSA